MGSPTSTLRNILRHRLLIISYSIKNVHLMIPKMNAWILYMHLIDRFLAEIGTFLFQGVAVVSLSLHSPPLWIRVSFMNLLLLYLYSTVYHSIIFFNCQLVQLSFHSAESFRCFLADNAMPVLSLFTVCRLYINIFAFDLCMFHRLDHFRCIFSRYFNKSITVKHIDCSD